MFLSKISRLAGLLLATVLATGLTACSNDDDSDIAISEVTIANAADGNALRYPVKVRTSKDCFVSLTYWPAREPGKEVTTEPVGTAGLKADAMIMFVKADTDYEFCVNINGRRRDDIYSFHTSSLPSGLPKYSIIVDNGGAPTDGYVLQWQATKPGWITFCDMNGEVVWYEEFDQAIRMAYYDPEVRKMCVLTGFRDGVNSKNFQRLADKIITLDLAGNREVNWIASDDNVPYPHHDIKYTPDGDLIMVCNTIKKFDLSQFELGDDTEVWGDGFTIISSTGDVKRRWNNFEEYTPFNSNDVILERGAVKDFLHANSVNWDSEGNYYMTFNRINQLWKIEASTGKVLYRVGVHGNVTMPAEGMPSGIHAAEPLATDKILCFDNGEERGYSRAVIYNINPSAMTATLELDVPIPSEYSSQDRSNVQLICDGKILMFASTLGRCNVFTDLQGNILKVLKRTGISYRSYYYPAIAY